MVSNWVRENRAIFFVGLIVVMCGSFLGFDRNFQLDSETLVTGPLSHNIEFVNKGDFPLGRYIGDDGVMTDYNKKNNPQVCMNDKMPNKKAFAISNNQYTQKMVKDLAFVKDKNGNEYKVEKYTYSGDSIRIDLQTYDSVSQSKESPVIELQYFDERGNNLPKGEIIDYSPQFGLQGLFFLHVLPEWLPLIMLRCIAYGFCIMMLAVVLTFICYLVGVKYNWWLSSAFLITFCTSPWIVNFAPNLYWVEFTWFIPMLIGLAVTMTDVSFKYRIFAYICAMISITVKCLCGYEYISTIILGMITFPTIELLKNLHNEAIIRKRYIKLVVGLLIAGVVGFIIALVMHGYVRGGGDLFAGLHEIYQRDVLRRTWGGDPSKFDSAFTPSLTASPVAVFFRYLVFSRPVVVGIPGFLFVFFGLFPLFIKWYYQRKNMILPWGADVWGLYVMGFLATMSWLMLAKAHSYVHTHLNFVLWYFGFVQVCFYCVLVVIRDKIINLLVQRKVIIFNWRENLIK